jgi:hypothetical protein
MISNGIEEAVKKRASFVHSPTNIFPPPLSYIHQLVNRQSHSMIIRELPAFIVVSTTFSFTNRRKLRRYFKLLGSPGIDSKESIPPAYAAWRAGMTTLFLLGS